MPRKPTTRVAAEAEITPERQLELKRGAKAIAWRVKETDERQKRKAEGTSSDRVKPIKPKKSVMPEDLRRARTKAVIVKVLSEGWSITKACREAKVQRCTVYEWRERDPEFRKAWDDAIVAGLDSIEDLVRNAGERDWRAGEAVLKAKRSEVWNPRQKTDVTLNASEGLLAALQAVELTARGLPVAEREPEAEPETTED
jgi:hypothetical protein